MDHSLAFSSRTMWHLLSSSRISYSQPVGCNLCSTNYHEKDKTEQAQTDTDRKVETLYSGIPCLAICSQ